MATIKQTNDVTPTTINKFLGINLSNTGDTQLKFGESGNMDNFYITSDYKLRKMYGYKTFYDFEHPVKGMFSTKIGNVGYLLVASNGKLYSFLQSDLENEESYIFGETKTLVVDGTALSFELEKENLTSINSIVVHSDQDPPEGYSIDLSIFPEGTFNLEEGIITFPAWFILEDLAGYTNVTLDITYSRVVEPNLLGNIGNGDCSFFEFDNKVYILCDGYYKWDGITLSEVEGYIPKVSISTSPSGGGTMYDELNMLTGKKHMTFNGDGTSTDYHLLQKDIASVDKVLVDGAETSAYTVNTSTGVVTFATAPSQGTDNVDIYWTKDDGDRSIIENMRFGTIFGGDIDTRVFLYGNLTCKNRIYYSGIAYEHDIAVPSVEYFPATSQIDVGPSNFAVTDLTRQYDRLLVTTNKPEGYWIQSSTEQLTVNIDGTNTTTKYVPSMATFPLNETHGNIAMGQGQLVNNYPVTIDRSGLTLWKATNVRDEKNIQRISQRIDNDLKSLNLLATKTLDHEQEQQIWFVNNNLIYIYNYGNDTFSRVRMPVSMDNITQLDGTVYTAIDDGKVVKWKDYYTDFDGEIINSIWEMNFSDFKTPYLRKTMRKMWISLQPQNNTSADVSYITNLISKPVTKTVSYKTQVLTDVDFSNFSFEISNNPQPFRLKMKAKKFTNMKIVVSNNEHNFLTVLGITMNIESFGESK